MSVPGRQQSRLELLLHPGDEYVGSWEPESLQVLTYVRLTKAPVGIKTSWQSPSGSCPLLLYGSKTVAARAEDIIVYLKEQGYSTAARLKDYQQAETVAYTALLKDRLHPAILYCRWVNGQNYVDVTRRWYGKTLPFPLSIFLPSWRQRSVQQRLMAGVVEGSGTEQRGLEDLLAYNLVPRPSLGGRPGNELVSKAEECIKLLSARLGEDDYFFGDSPSPLDSLVFGYLELLLQCPLPSNNSLHTQLHSCVNLVMFCERIRRSCFPDVKSRSAQAHSSTRPPSTPATLWKDPTLWLCVGVGVLVLGMQGVRVGLWSGLRQWASLRFGRLREEEEDPIIME